MPRRRMIDPDFWNDSKVKKLTHLERLFLIGIISHADDEGRLLGSPAFLRSRIFPYDDFSLDEIKKMRDHIATINPNIHIYTVNGNDDDEFICLLKWRNYQKPDHPSKSKIPPPQNLPNDSPNESVNESPNDSHPDHKPPRDQSSLGQSSLVKYSIVSRVYAREDFDNEKELTDRLTTDLTNLRPRGTPFIMSELIKPLFKEAGIDIDDKMFEMIHHIISKQPDEIAVPVLVKAVRYAGKKRSPLSYIKRILDEKTGDE